MNKSNRHTPDHNPPGDPYTLCELSLPPPKPYLNRKQRYPVGNGILFAVGDGNGGWLRLAGPGYTIGTIRDSLFTAEQLALEVDGVRHALAMDMHRAAKTGVFYGTADLGGIRVALVDLARWGCRWMARVVLIENASATPHRVRLHASLDPAAGVGAPAWTLVKDAAGKNAGFTCPGFLPTCALIAMADPAATANFRDARAELVSGEQTLAPGASAHLALCHHGIAPDANLAEFIARARAIAYRDELAACIREWTAWFDGVAPEYRLERIADPRARDMVEGGLAILKTNQSQDGGLIAHATHYTQGYFRDAALGLRGFDATGHYEESKRWLQWTQSKFLAFRHIPNWACCLSSLSERGNMQDLGNQDMESTALCVLAARDYVRATGDWEIVESSHGFIQYCMDAQLRHAATNDYRMEFCGDETEICGAVDVAASGMKHRFKQAAEHYWSMTSVALCAAALEFYIEYVKRRGSDPSAYTNSLSGAALDLRQELDRLIAAMDRDYWRTDLPDYPGGVHDAFRVKKDNALPERRISNFTLFPVYFETPYRHPDRKARDVTAILRHFDHRTGFLQLIPGADTGFDGHTLGYLLWTLLDIGHPAAAEVCQALVNGPTADCWGSFAEAYSKDGVPNEHDLRTFETGCNISAIARHWRLGWHMTQRDCQ